MTDQELFKLISQAVREVPAHKIGEAVAKVRALFAVEVSTPAPMRSERGGRDRMERSGLDRSE